MSETNTVADNQAETTKPAEEKKIVVLDNVDGVEYIEQQFEDDADSKNPVAGWKFAQPNFTSTEQLVKHLDKLCKAQGRDNTGDKIVLELASRAINLALRTKIKNDQPEFKGPNAEQDSAAHYEGVRARRPDGLIFNVAEASTWLPGTRSQSGLKLMKSLVDQLADLMATGKTGADPEVMQLIGRIVATKK